MKQQRHFIKGLLFILITPVLTACANLADRWINTTRLNPPYQVNPEADKLHQQLHIVDLHADPLLWDRDLLQKSRYGHVDLPRLQEGNVTLQVFGVVTGVPFPLKMEDNTDKWDVITLLGFFQKRPDVVQKSRLQRALFQADKLQERIRASNNELKLIKSREDVTGLLAERTKGKKVIGAMLSLEGSHALLGNPANIETLFNAGYRMLGLVHLFSNNMAGSSHGKSRHGLTEKGREMVQLALARGMIIDLAHASEQTIDDVLAIVDRPVIASHGGVRGTCDTARNLSDRHIRGIAKTGGVIGIGIYKYATCGKSLQDTARAMRYVADLVGIKHVALGSDFDGAVKTVIDASGLSLLTDALLQAGFTPADIKAIMGDNALRVFQQTLPRKE